MSEAKGANPSTLLRSIAGVCTLLAAIYMSLSSASAQPIGSGGPSTVHGTVRDTNGRPVAGVTIRLDGGVPRSARTIDDGTFAMSDVPPGSYTLFATHQGYEPAHERTVIGGDTSLVLDVTLAAATLASLEVIGRTSTISAKADSIRPPRRRLYSPRPHSSIKGNCA